VADPLNPLSRLAHWRSTGRQPAKLYGAIVAQARLPIFYQSLGVPDTIDGRFAILALHLFAVLNRLKAEGPAGVALAQALMDRFTADMETVLRELGVSDLKVPKSMRKIAASSRTYEAALPEGEAALAAAIAAALPLGPEPARAASSQLAPYLLGVVRLLAIKSVASLLAGELEFPQIREP
jgi:cytochrome b pre-mRNA-processing protein 3